MASISFSHQLFLTIICFLALKIIPTIGANANETSIKFYYHERTAPPNATAIKVVTSPINQTDPVFTFGNIFVFDDPMTEDLDPASRLLGRVQGVLAITSLDGYDGLYTFNCVFTDMDPWTGSTLTITGRNPTHKAIKELPVVGGTGAFRFSRGYIVLERLSPIADVLTFKVEVTIFNN